MDFLKRTELFVNITCLHSRSRVINQMKDFKLCELTGSKYDPKTTLLKKSMKGWFVPVDLIREYYGEEVAVYFEWLNFFLRWMIVPAAGGLVIRLFNTFYFEPSRSPMSALFAIAMSIWAALFAINWKKHERSLRILWDNLVLTESKQQQIREAFKGVPKVNPITEMTEPYYSSTDRMFRYIESFIVCFVLLFFIFIYLIAAYNITGVITEDKWNSLFYWA